MSALANYVSALTYVSTRRFKGKRPRVVAERDVRLLKADRDLARIQISETRDDY